MQTSDVTSVPDPSDVSTTRRVSVRTTSLAYAVRTADAGMVRTLLGRGAKVTMAGGDDCPLVADTFGNPYEAALLFTAVNNCAGNRYRLATNGWPF